MSGAGSGSGSGNAKLHKFARMGKKDYLCTAIGMKIVRGILVILNVLVAVALVVSTLAATVSPSRSIVPSLAAYGYLPLLAANVLMVVVWVMLKPWYSLISVAAVAARWMFVGLFVQVAGLGGAPVKAEGAAEVRLMSYNVHLFRGRGAKAGSTDSVAQGFLRLTDEWKPEVLCLQEFALPKRVKVVDSLLVRGYNHYYATNTSAKGMPYGTVVFSKLPITYVNRIDGEKLLVELMCEEGRFRVCNVHMGSYHFDEADWQELDRVKHGDVSASLKRTLDKVRSAVLDHEKAWEQKLRPIVEESRLPLVLAGDLNDTPASWLYHQIDRHLDDTFCERGLGVGFTYNGGFPHYRIDAIFHSKGLRTLAHKRVRSHLSDHYPVVATLELVP
mgnify:CR=1 FL=1